MQGLEKLKDIKPPVEVHDISFLLFLALIIAIFMVAFVLGYYLYNRLKKKRRRKRKSKKEIAKERLKAIGFSDTKNAVYEFSENAAILAEGDIEKEKKLSNILKELEIYKYKRDVPPLSQKHIKLMKDFIKELRNG